MRRECCNNYFESNIVTKNIGQVPIAGFEEAPSGTCVNQSLAFTARFGGATASYHWNFGEAAVPATAEGRIVSEVRWTSGGIKTVNLTTKINDCTNSNSTSVTVVNCLMGLGQFDGFEGYAILEEAHIDLRWNTLEEPYESRFIVERANAERNRFYTLDVMPAYGGVERNSYNFKDTQPQLGYNYYRIKHIDSNGDYLFSETIPVLWRPPIVKDIVIRPNPFKDRTRLQVIEPLEEGGTIQLTNSFGQVLKIIDLPVDKPSLELDLSAYPKGLYFIYHHV